MKIIKRGKWVQEHQKNECSRCGTIYEYEQADIKYYHSDDGQSIYWVYCPTCNLQQKANKKPSN